jgi:hypothetical protein
MGMSMRIERSNVDQVRKRIEMNKAKQTEVEKEYNFEERMKELKEEVCQTKKDYLLKFVLFFIGRQNESTTT